MFTAFALLVGIVIGIIVAVVFYLRSIQYQYDLSSIRVGDITLPDVDVVEHPAETPLTRQRNQDLDIAFWNVARSRGWDRELVQLPPEKLLEFRLAWEDDRTVMWYRDTTNYRSDTDGFHGTNGAGA